MEVYAAALRAPTRLWTEPILTMEPLFCLIMKGSTALTHHCVPIKQTRKDFSHSSSGASPALCQFFEIYAALLHKTSIRPLRAAAAFTTRSTWSGCETSH